MRVIRIGRDASNDYIINHPTVSGFHADLYVYDNGAMQLVEHSANGTYVNQKYIHNNTCIILGNEVLTFPSMQAVPVSKILNTEAKSDTEKPEEINMVDIPKENGTPHAKPGMGFGETLSHFFSNYTNFSGRARRQEYWYIFLWNLLLGIIPFVNIIWGLITLIPGVALSVRRLHDIGKSGLWLLLAFVPFVGGIILFIWTITDSDTHSNEYGPSPKYT